MRRKKKDKVTVVERVDEELEELIEEGKEVISLVVAKHKENCCAGNDGESDDSHTIVKFLCKNQKLTGN